MYEFKESFCVFRSKSPFVQYYKRWIIAKGLDKVTDLFMNWIQAPIFLWKLLDVHNIMLVLRNCERKINKPSGSAFENLNTKSSCDACKLGRSKIEWFMITLKYCRCGAEHIIKVATLSNSLTQFSQSRWQRNCWLKRKATVIFHLEIYCGRISILSVIAFYLG